MLLFSLWVMSESLRPHGLQLARPLCPLLSPGVCSDWCALSAVSSSVACFSFWLQSFPASESFPVCQLFASYGQSIGAGFIFPFVCVIWNDLLRCLIDLKILSYIIFHEVILNDKCISPGSPTSMHQDGIKFAIYVVEAWYPSLRWIWEDTGRDQESYQMLLWPVGKRREEECSVVQESLGKSSGEPLSQSSPSVGSPLCWCAVLLAGRLDLKAVLAGFQSSVTGALNCTHHGRHNLEAHVYNCYNFF